MTSLQATLVSKRGACTTAPAPRDRQAGRMNTDDRLRSTALPDEARGAERPAPAPLAAAPIDRGAGPGDDRPLAELPRGLHAALLAFAGVGFAIVELVVLHLAIVVVLLCLIVVGLPLVAPLLRLVGADAERQRGWARRHAGVAIAAAHRPVAEGEGWLGLGTSWRRLRDPLLVRELLWHLVNPVVGMLLAALPLGLMLHGVWGTVALVLHLAGVPLAGNVWYLFLPLLDTGWFFAAAVLGVIELALGWWFARDLLRLHGRWVRAILGSDPAELLRARVDHLAATRSSALELQEAELRRIERDLHDGAQARLVATGMTIDRAAELLDSDPTAARALLDAAKAQQADALGELRALVRGIRPPVLADRGLADALHALAATATLRVVIDSRLDHRLAGPLESALYFAAAELIANAAKHADPQRIDVKLDSADGLVTMLVRDDGRGGADAGRAEGGLAGIRRRLAPFDGALELTSPLGGPTVATVRVPEVRAAAGD